MISTLPEASNKIIKALWDNLKIPLTAYGSSRNHDDSYEKWTANQHGISNVLITPESVAA
jgi:hypothetical protein